MTSVCGGDVVMARVGGEVSVRRLETCDGFDCPVSPMGTMELEGSVPQVQVLGKVVGLIRPAC